MTATVARRRIDLNLHRTAGARGEVFSGRHRGKAVRLVEEMDKAERDGCHFDIVVPEDVTGVTSSFIDELIGEAVSRLGEAAFREAYHFSGHDISDVVEFVIRARLRRGNPLAV